MRMSKNYLWGLLLILFAVIGSVGCQQGGNPIGPRYDNVGDVKGIELYKDGNEIVRIWDGEVDGYAEVNVGNNKEVYHVEFLDENEYAIDFKGKEFSLALTNGNDDFITLEQNSKLGKWQFYIHGKKAGQSDFEILLLNEINNKSYNTQAIRVKVE